MYSAARIGKIPSSGRAPVMGGIAAEDLGRANGPAAAAEAAEKNHRKVVGIFFFSYTANCSSLACTLLRVGTKLYITIPRYVSMQRQPFFFLYTYYHIRAVLHGYLLLYTS